MPDFSESVPILLPAPKSVKWGGGFLPWEKAEFRIDSAGLPVGDFLTIEYPGGMPAQNYEISVSESGISVRAGSEKARGSRFKPSGKSECSPTKEGLGSWRYPMLRTWKCAGLC